MGKISQIEMTIIKHIYWPFFTRERVGDISKISVLCGVIIIERAGNVKALLMMGKVIKVWGIN